MTPAFVKRWARRLFYLDYRLPDAQAIFSPLTASPASESFSAAGSSFLGPLSRMLVLYTALKPSSAVSFFLIFEGFLERFLRASWF